MQYPLLESFTYMWRFQFQVSSGIRTASCFDPMLQGSIFAEVLVVVLHSYICLLLFISYLDANKH